VTRINKETNNILTSSLMQTEFQWAK